MCDDMSLACAREHAYNVQHILQSDWIRGRGRARGACKRASSLCARAVVSCVASQKQRSLDRSIAPLEHARSAKPRAASRFSLPSRALAHTTRPHMCVRTRARLKDVQQPRACLRTLHSARARARAEPTPIVYIMLFVSPASALRLSVCAGLLFSHAASPVMCVFKRTRIMFSTPGRCDGSQCRDEADNEDAAPREWHSRTANCEHTHCRSLAGRDTPHIAAELTNFPNDVCKRSFACDSLGATLAFAGFVPRETDGGGLVWQRSMSSSSVSASLKTSTRALVRACVRVRSAGSVSRARIAWLINSCRRSDGGPNASE